MDDLSSDKSAQVDVIWKGFRKQFSPFIGRRFNFILWESFTCTFLIEHGYYGVCSMCNFKYRIKTLAATKL